MEDKDRLGDKLREKEKAAEDLFIAERERAQIERLRATMKGTAGGTGGCPRDGEHLSSRTEHGVTVGCCPKCGGIWLDKGELEAIIRREEESRVTHWLRTFLGR